MDGNKKALTEILKRNEITKITITLKPKSEPKREPRAKS